MQVEKISPKTCRRYGEKKVVDGLQYENVWYSCKDRKGCPYCRNVYVYVSGRYNAVNEALADGAKTYTMEEDAWDTVKKQADRTGIDGYIRIKSENDIVYFVAKFDGHEQATEIDPKSVDWEHLISHSKGRSQFRGKYTNKEQEDAEETMTAETVKLISYLPVFTYRDTGKPVPDTEIDDWIFIYLYINPKWSEINASNAEDFLKWRACVVAEAMLFIKPNWEVSHMSVDEIDVPKEELENGTYVTNYRIKYMGFSGREIKNVGHKNAIELLMGITEPKIPFSAYQKGNYRPEYNDGTVKDRLKIHEDQTFEHYGIYIPEQAEKK